MIHKKIYNREQATYENEINFLKFYKYNIKSKYNVFVKKITRIILRTH